MEYHIFHKIRQKIRIPFFARLFIGILFIIFGIFTAPIPFIPGFVFIVLGSLFLIPANKIKSLRKIRKGIIHLFKNLHCKITIKRKFIDFFKHSKDILKKKKIKKIIKK